MDSPNLIIAEVSDDMSATNHVAPQCKNVQDHLNTASVLPDEQNYDKDANYLEPVKKSVISSVGNMTCTGCKEGFDKHHETCTSVGATMKFHQQCCVCYECKTNLSDLKHCYTKEGHIYCKEDYFKVFGARCTKCFKQIQSDDLVHRVEDKCVCCHTDLKGGQEVAFSQDTNNFLCQSDYQKWQNTINAKYQGMPHRGTRHMNYMHHQVRDEYLQPQMYSSCPPMSASMVAERKSRKRKQERKPRERTVYSDTQLSKLVNYYQENPRPSTQVKDKIAEELEIPKKKVSVWFQNRRCKDKKKMERDERMELAKQQDEESRVLQETVLQSEYPCMSPLNYMCKPMQLKPSVIQGPMDHTQPFVSGAPMDMPGDPMTCIAPIPHIIPMVTLDPFSAPVRPNMPSFSTFPFPPSLPAQSGSPLTPQPPCSPNHHMSSTPIQLKYQNSPLEADSPISSASELSPNELSSSQNSWDYPAHTQPMQPFPHIHYPTPPMGMTAVQCDNTSMGFSQGLYHNNGTMETTSYEPPMHPTYDNSVHYHQPPPTPFHQPATPYMQAHTPYEPHPCLS